MQSPHAHRTQTKPSPRLGQRLLVLVSLLSLIGVLAYIADAEQTQPMNSTRGHLAG